MNNAGRGQRAAWEETSLEVDRHCLELNVLGHLSLTKSVLPHMMNRGEGHIVVTCGVEGKIGELAASARTMEFIYKFRSVYFLGISSHSCPDSYQISLIPRDPSSGSKSLLHVRDMRFTGTQKVLRRGTKHVFLLRHPVSKKKEKGLQFCTFFSHLLELHIVVVSRSYLAYKWGNPTH